MDSPKLKLYFEEPRLKMTVMGRFLVRTSFYVGYLVIASVTLLFVLSRENNSAYWLGLLLTLFLIDRIFHVGEGEDSIKFLPKDGQYNLARLLSAKSYAVIESSFDKTLLSGADFRLFLIRKLLDQKEVETALLRLEVKKTDFLTQAEREFSKEPMKRKEEMLELIQAMVFEAFKSAYEGRRRFIDPKDLFGSLSGIKDSRLTRLFAVFSIEEIDLVSAIIATASGRSLITKILNPSEASGAYPFHLRHRVMNRAWTARPTHLLDSLSDDFTDLARAGALGFLIGHEKEYERLSDVLARPEKPLAMLVGEPGVGKEAIVQHLAYNIVKDNVPENLFDKRLVALSVSRLVAGVSGGELEGRIMKVVDEIETAGNIILYIPDIDNLAKTSGNEFLSVADVFVPAIRRGSFPVIGATYPREFKRFVEPNTDFVSAFEIIRIEEISEENAMKVLTFMALALERQYRVTVSMGAVKKAVILAHKYFRDKPLPVSAEDLLKEAISEAVRLKEGAVSGDMLVSVAERKVNIPIHQVDTAEASKLLNMEEIIHKRLVDQEEAVSAVSRSLREYRSGLTRKGGPIAAFLFVGPTGVGKTELSKILAQIQFGSEDMLTRFDMSEYQDKQSFFRFIGSPDGSVNGALTDAILEKPYSILLLDEFEKAYPDILNLFLQVFDDGRLTDNLGRTADFKNVIIVATSNAHSAFIQKSLEEGKPMAAIAEEVKKHLVDYFKPELINRFSDIIVFKPLSPEDTRKIAELLLRGLADDLMEAQNIKMDFDRSVANKIAELGFSETFGARPLRKVISEKLRGPIAEKILKGEILKNGGVSVKVENGEFVFTAS